MIVDAARALLNAEVKVGDRVDFTIPGTDDVEKGTVTHKNLLVSTVLTDSGRSITTTAVLKKTQ